MTAWSGGWRGNDMMAHAADMPHDPNADLSVQGKMLMIAF